MTGRGFGKWYNRRLAKERGAQDWRRSTRLQPLDARETDSDVCPRSRFGKHRFQEQLIDASGRPICDFCHQVRLP